MIRKQKRLLAVAAARDGDDLEGAEAEAMLTQMVEELVAGRGGDDAARSTSSSSGSSSVDSSSASDSGAGSECAAEGEEEEPLESDAESAGSSEQVLRAPARAGLPRAPGIAEEIFVLQNNQGSIHFNYTGSFLRAHCSVHGEKCVRQRTTRASEAMFRTGQGRPIGLLVSWLLRAPEAETRTAHRDMRVSPLADRVHARNAFYAMAGGQQFASQFERALADQEPEEPNRIP